MQTQPLFSIIVPVYNVEAYLRECVNSVLNQTYADFEIILVDDGSPDMCPRICDTYQERDDRVRVVHKANGGLSEARNFGIDAAQGHYILFLDGDDYWDDLSALYQIKQELEKGHFSTDVMLFQAKLLYPDGTLLSDRGKFIDTFFEMDRTEQLEYMSANGLLIGSACSKVVKREFIRKNHLYFKEGLKSEDIDWIIRVADCLPKYQYTDQYFYIYRRGRCGSITSNVDEAYLNQFMEMLRGFISYNYTSERVRRCLLGYVAYEYSILMAKAVNLNKTQQKEKLLSEIQKMQDILRYDIHPKIKNVNRVKKIFGYRVTLMVLGMYLKYRGR